jgi:hypothetical protein
MTFAIIIAIVLFLISYMLFTPISFELYKTSSVGEKPKARIRIFPFPFINLSTGIKSKKKTVSAKKPQVKPKRTNRSGLIWYLLSDWYLLEIIVIDFIRLLIGLFKCPDRYFFNIDLCGGLSQPHHTGQLYGVICAITPALPESINIRYQPDFSDESIRAGFSINITIRLAAILLEFIKFLFRLPGARIIKIAWNYRKDSNYAYQN